MTPDFLPEIEAVEGEFCLMEALEIVVMDDNDVDIKLYYELGASQGNYLQVHSAYGHGYTTLPFSLVLWHQAGQ